MRPYVLLSAAVSVDGYLDDASSRRLLLSGEADFDRVDEVRAGVDAILVGATTVRRDDPRLRVRSDARRDARVARGWAIALAIAFRAAFAGTHNVRRIDRFVSRDQYHSLHADDGCSIANMARADRIGPNALNRILFDYRYVFQRSRMKHDIRPK